MQDIKYEMVQKASPNINNNNTRIVQTVHIIILFREYFFRAYTSF